MQEKEGERALGVSEVTSLTVMRDARGHRGILKSWFHNKWWFCFFRAKCGLPHYSLKTVGWCRTTDGLLDPKSQAGFHKLLPSKYKHMVAVLAVKCFKMANVVSITRTKEARESRNDWTIYKQDGASVVRFLWKPLFVNESSDPQVHAKRPVLRNDWFNHEASRPQCLMTQDGSSPHRRAHRKISSGKAVQK